MFGFYVNGDFLYLEKDAKISIEYNTPIYTGGDPTDITGTYTFPVSIEMNGHNRNLLRHADRPDSVGDSYIYEDVQVYVEGLPLFIGRMVINSAGKKAKASVVVNLFSSLKDKSLQELIPENLTGPYQWSHIQDVCNSDPNIPLCFVPVFNKSLTDDDDTVNENYYRKGTMNYWELADQEFKNNEDHRSVVPFVQLKWTLLKIFENAGIPLIQNFFDEELEKLYLYNNYSICDGDGNYDYLESITYANHLPKIKANEFIKQICSMFFLGIFPDQNDKVVHIRSMDDVIAAAERHDWTDYLESLEVVYNAEVPKLIKYEDDGNDGYVSTDIRSYDFTEIEFYEDLPPTVDNLWYRCLVHDQYVHYNHTTAIPGLYLKNHTWFNSISLDRGNKEYNIKPSPLLMNFHPLHLASYETMFFMPKIDNQVIRQSETDTRNDSSSFGTRLFFFRGMQPSWHGPSYPLGSSNEYNAVGDVIGNYSLLLDGTRGTVSTFAQKYLHYLQHTKQVKAKLNLPIREILNFKSWDKIRIQNMNYFVSNMKITASAQGMGTVTATLQTVN